MTGLDLLLAIAGLTVTVLVVVGMILITPRGQVEVIADRPDAAEAEVRANGNGPTDTAAEPKLETR